MEEKVAILEALIFASETPLTAERVMEILPEADKAEIVSTLRELVRGYEQRGGGGDPQGGCRRVSVPHEAGPGFLDPETQSRQGRHADPGRFGDVGRCGLPDSRS